MKKFSDFTLREALVYAGIKDFTPWSHEVGSQAPSATFIEQRRRLYDHFDLEISEAGHELLIDVFLAEAIDPFEQLKIWKEAPLETRDTKGVIDYLLAPTGAVYEAPLLALGEAKKEDFERGTAQCVAEMRACIQWNEERDNAVPSIFGIVTNGQLWQFLEFIPGPPAVCRRSEVFASSTSTDSILAILNSIFTTCAERVPDF